MTGGSSTINYVWNFGDGSSSTLASPTHFYNTPGSYIIDVTATSTNSCYDTTRRSVTVYVVPVLSFNIAAQYLVSSGAITLIGAPVGGTFSGQGISGNTFTPAIAGAGTWGITYTYTDPVTGCTRSLTKTVVVIESPSIRTQPATQSVCLGSSVSLSVFARGSNISYQWYKNGTAISGQTAAVLTFNPVALLNAGSYSVRVANTVDTVYSNNAVLTVNLATSSTVNASFCSGTNYTLPNGNVVNTAGTYVSVIPNAKGCDSTITTILSINTGGIINQSLTSCDSYVWSLNGQTYTQSGVYTATSACNTVILNLTITPSTSSTTTASSCDLYTWSINGQIYSQSGTYTAVVGCVTHTLNLTITQTTTIRTTASACDSYTWAGNGQTYTQSGSYQFISGCQVNVLNLTITPSTSNTTTASSCDSYTWSVNGQTYTQSGSYTSVTVCNTEVLNLTITPSTSNTTTASSCDSYTWLVNGQAYTQSGSYTSVTGCNTEVLNLTITPSTSNTTTASSCDSYTWSVNGQAYTQSGSYTSVTGCNTEVLNLTITPSTLNTTAASSCDSYTWSVNGQAYTQSGTYSSVTGCNTEILNLTITPSTSNTTTASSCDSYTWSVNGQAYTQSGSYTSVTGCNTAVLNLTITPRSSNTTTASSCGSYQWVANSQTYTTSGNYTFVNGCNTQYLNLTINTNSVAASAANASSTSINSGSAVTLSVSGGSLGAGASWKWYSGSCGGTLIGTGASISVSPTSTTTYYVRAEGTCNTTTCTSVTVTVQSACGPTAVISNVANNTICSERSVVLTVQGTLGSGASWKWYKNGCGTGASIGSGSTLTVSVSSTTTYYVRSMGGTCGTTSCKSITITKSSTPSTPGTITGTASGVCNAVGVRYSIAAVLDATSYVWTVPTGATIVSGQGTTSIIVNYGNSLGVNSSCGSSSVCVKAVNTCGSSSSQCLSISAVPNHNCSNITGPSTACINIAATYSCAVSNGATYYSWILPSGWTIVSGQGTNSIVVKPGSTQGTIKVTPLNACGSGTSISKSVKSSRCTTPTYSRNDLELNPESIKDVSVWPNPANGFVNLNDGGLKADKIEMFEATGRLVMSTNWKTRIELGRFRKGFYILKIQTNEGVKVKRVEVM